MAEKRTTKAAPASKAAASKGKRPQQGKVAKEINDTIRYTTWSVFKAATPLGDRDRAAVVREVEELVAQLAAEDVVVRGFYDVAARVQHRNLALVLDVDEHAPGGTIRDGGLRFSVERNGRHDGRHGAPGP